MKWCQTLHRDKMSSWHLVEYKDFGKMMSWNQSRIVEFFYLGSFAGAWFDFCWKMILWRGFHVTFNPFSRKYQKMIRGKEKLLHYLLEQIVFKIPLLMQKKAEYLEKMIKLSLKKMIELCHWCLKGGGERIWIFTNLHTLSERLASWVWRRWNSGSKTQIWAFPSSSDGVARTENASQENFRKLLRIAAPHRVFQFQQWELFYGENLKTFRTIFLCCNNSNGRLFSSPGICTDYLCWTEEWF